MRTNVDRQANEILSKLNSQLKPLLIEAIQKADAQARGELIAQVSSIGGSMKTGTAPVKRRPGRPRKNPVEAVAAPVKRKPGRPRKNPLPETVAAAADKPKKKAKAKRVISEEARKQLAENLKKAREAKAAKAKPVKRKVKSESETATQTAQA